MHPRQKWQNHNCSACYFRLYRTGQNFDDLNWVGMFWTTGAWYFCLSFEKSAKMCSTDAPVKTFDDRLCLPLPDSLRTTSFSNDTREERKLSPSSSRFLQETEIKLTLIDSVCCCSAGVPTEVLPQEFKDDTQQHVVVNVFTTMQLVLRNSLEAKFFDYYSFDFFACTPYC